MSNLTECLLKSVSWRATRGVSSVKRVTLINSSAAPRNCTTLILSLSSCFISPKETNHSFPSPSTNTAYQIRNGGKMYGNEAHRYSCLEVRFSRLQATFVLNFTSRQKEGSKVLFGVRLPSEILVF